MAGLDEKLDVVKDHLVEIIDTVEGMRAGLHLMASPDNCYGGRLNEANYAMFRAVGDLLEAHYLLGDETQKLQGAPCGGSNPRKRKKKNVWGEEIDE
jgi:hypothetical protein